MEDGGDSEAGFFEEVCDGNEVVVVRAFIGPMDADEGFVAGGFDADDGASGSAPFDGFEGDGNGRVHAEELAC